mmetsp:Transcript_7375/g.14523  ORF Transcript_7375/g.14523 Transcript_7375/m.14523 type:complete len:248 (-) Transcript_7375:214-957(-)
MPRVPLPAISPALGRLPAVISPSILSADFARLAEECNRMIVSGADWLHVDVMDGHFVPNLTIGHPIVQSLRKNTDAFLDCHLMVSHPKQWVQDFAKAGADMYTFHLESVSDISNLSADAADASVVSLCKEIHATGMHCGISVKPKTPVELILPYLRLGLIDMVLIMTVEPGFGGQKFMADMLSKVRVVREQFPAVHIQVDGGLTTGNSPEAAAAGANVIVAGTAIFGAPNAAEAISQIRAAVDGCKA